LADLSLNSSLRDMERLQLRGRRERSASDRMSSRSKIMRMRGPVRFIATESDTPAKAVNVDTC
jgi:hypothetical protein